MSEAALTSEAAYEAEVGAKLEWGRDNAGIIDRACRQLRAVAAPNLVCREPRR